MQEGGPGAPSAAVDGDLAPLGRFQAGQQGSGAPATVSCKMLRGPRAAGVKGCGRLSSLPSSFPSWEDTAGALRPLSSTDTSEHS